MGDPIEDFIPVSGTDDVLDTTLVTQEDGTKAHREGVFIGDPAEAAARAAVAKNSAAAYALTVSDRRLEFIQEALENILTELKITNKHLHMATDEEFEESDIV